jgi:protein-disulfide isomerase
MYLKKLLSIAIATTTLILPANLAAQAPDEVIAKATGHVVRFKDLREDGRAAALKLPEELRAARTTSLDQMLAERVLQMEARKQGTTVGRLLANVRSKIADPPAAEITKLFEANRTSLSSYSEAEARQIVVDHLRRKPEQDAVSAFITELQTRYKATAGKSVNASDLKPDDVVATIDGKPVTAAEFEKYAAFDLYDLRATAAERVRDAAAEMLLNSLIKDEAASLSIEAGDLIAREMTSKMKDYSDEERLALEGAFRGRLFTKYKAEILLGLPEPPVFTVDIANSAAIGPADAKAVIVMFSDLQCSACAAAHPIIKNVIADYPNKVRFVVRNFPLEGIHQNAHNAALAARAAFYQGKFFEFAEILYKNQDKLSPPSLLEFAKQAGLNTKQFEIDSKSEKAVAEVERDLRDGEMLQISGTPTVFVNGIRMRRISAVSLRDAIERALAK